MDKKNNNEDSGKNPELDDQEQKREDLAANEIDSKSELFPLTEEYIIKEDS